MLDDDWNEHDNISELSINDDDAVIIPKMATDKLGVAMVHSSQSIKVDDDGYLYIQFTNGWTDITNEKTEINFFIFIAKYFF